MIDFLAQNWFLFCVGSVLLMIVGVFLMFRVFRGQVQSMPDTMANAFGAMSEAMSDTEAADEIDRFVEGTFAGFGSMSQNWLGGFFRRSLPLMVASLLSLILFVVAAIGLIVTIFAS